MVEAPTDEFFAGLESPEQHTDGPPSLRLCTYEGEPDPMEPRRAPAVIVSGFTADDRRVWHEELLAGGWTLERIEKREMDDGSTEKRAYYENPAYPNRDYDGTQFGGWSAPTALAMMRKSNA